MIASSAHAQGVATFNFQRGSIAIERAKPPYMPAMPWQDKETERQKETARIALTVDIRPIAALYRQAGWMNLSGLSGTEGMLFVLDNPDIARLSRMEYFQPLDVLWIDANGTITSLAPNLSVAELSQPMVDSKPSKALLLLAGGIAAKLSINPGDQVKDSEFFRPPPAVITLPQ